MDRYASNLPTEGQTFRRGLERSAAAAALVRPMRNPGRQAGARSLRPVLAELEAAGVKGTRAIARALNERGVPTPAGKRWHQTSMVRVLRLAGSA
jgi:hypothetical protein